MLQHSQTKKKCFQYQLQFLYFVPLPLPLHLARKLLKCEPQWITWPTFHPCSFDDKSAGLEQHIYRSSIDINIHSVNQCHSFVHCKFHCTNAPLADICYMCVPNAVALWLRCRALKRKYLLAQRQKIAQNPQGLPLPSRAHSSQGLNTVCTPALLLWALIEAPTWHSNSRAKRQLSGTLGLCRCSVWARWQLCQRNATTEGLWTTLKHTSVRCCIVHQLSFKVKPFFKPGGMTIT